MTVLEKSLKETWRVYRQANPKVRIRDAAEQLGVTEAELVATACGEGTVRLQGDWQQIVHRLADLGPVMALTRNKYAVHEKHGAYSDVRFQGRMGMVLDEGIDLRLFMHHWHSGFAVENNSGKNTLSSFQFFDRHGTAVHKVYLTGKSNRDAYEGIIEAFRSSDQSTTESVQPAKPSTPDRPDGEIDVPGLEEAWKALENTHDFHRVLNRFRVGRVQALRLVDDELAWRVDRSSVAQVLDAAVQEQIAIMVFVGNQGVVQIHSGAINKVAGMGPWLNIMDDDFTLHLREDQVDSAWVVRKPSSNGLITSLELYDQSGETIVQFFALRKQGKDTVEAWERVLNTLEQV